MARFVLALLVAAVCVASQARAESMPQTKLALRELETFLRGLKDDSDQGKGCTLDESALASMPQWCEQAKEKVTAMELLKDAAGKIPDTRALRLKSSDKKESFCLFKTKMMWCKKNGQQVEKKEVMTIAMTAFQLYRLYSVATALYNDYTADSTK